MTLKSYLLVMSLLTALAWTFFLFVAGLVDPFQTNQLGFFLFYISLFAALSGFIFLIGFVIRFIALKKELEFNLVRNAFRQSFLLASFVVALLILKSQDMLSGLNSALLIIIFSILELFLTSYKKSR
jgi:hypothetical protein